MRPVAGEGAAASSTDNVPKAATDDAADSVEPATRQPDSLPRGVEPTSITGNASTSEVVASGIVPAARARLAVDALLRLVLSVHAGSTRQDVATMFCMRQRWSSFNVPLFWPAAAGRNTYQILDWMCSVLDAETRPCEFEGAAIASL